MPPQSLLDTDPVSPLPPRPSSPILLPLDPPRKPVFGIDLDQLFERDGSAVPMIVNQCIQAVDLYGLEVDGVYSKPGAQSQVNKLRDMFDTGMFEIIK
jgi:hypothetical protein